MEGETASDHGRTRDMSRVAVVTPSAFATVQANAHEDVEVRRLDGVQDLAGAQFVVPAHDTVEIHAALRTLPSLEVVQMLGAGTDGIEHSVAKGVVLCSARGTRDVPVSEWVIAALLGAATGLLTAPGLSDHERRQWRELHGSTVVVLGFGSIGAAVAARLEPFGVQVMAIASRARHGVHGVEELQALLPSADALVVLTPLTDATRGLVDARALSALPDQAVVINASRGPVIDKTALEAELMTGRLRAVLDVTDPEPLPVGDVLWTARGTLAVTPHLAGNSLAGHQRASRFAAEQLGRWARNEPLANIVRQR